MAHNNPTGKSSAADRLASLQQMLATFGEGGASRGRSKLDTVAVRLPRVYVDLLRDLGEELLDSSIHGRTKKHVPLLYRDKGAVAPWFVAALHSLESLSHTARWETFSAKKKNSALEGSSEPSMALEPLRVETIAAPLKR